jgi:phosphoadenosine phosphosulfate reductase
MSDAISELQKHAAHLPAEELLRFALAQFGSRVALASSFGAEDQVITDMLCRLAPAPRIFTLDTGRLPQETYEAIQATRQKYGISIRILFPDQAQVESMVAQHGPNLFYDNIQNRKKCCEVRKVIPLRRELATLDAWVTGLRREQAETRTQVERIAWDAGFGLIKLNPLADWTTDQVWNYIRRHDVPYNALHDKGYPSIGCGPCTRAVKPGESLRAGRWWWELPEHKECGLHVAAAHLTHEKRPVQLETAAATSGAGAGAGTTAA